MISIWFYQGRLIFDFEVVTSCQSTRRWPTCLKEMCSNVTWKNECIWSSSRYKIIYRIFPRVFYYQLIYKWRPLFLLPSKANCGYVYEIIVIFKCWLATSLYTSILSYLRQRLSTKTMLNDDYNIEKVGLIRYIFNDWEHNNSIQNINLLMFVVHKSVLHSWILIFPFVCWGFAKLLVQYSFSKHFRRIINEIYREKQSEFTACSTYILT